MVLDVAHRGSAARADVVVARHGIAKVRLTVEACRAGVVLRVDEATAVDVASADRNVSDVVEAGVALSEGVVAV